MTFFDNKIFFAFTDICPRAASDKNKERNKGSVNQKNYFIKISNYINS